VVSPSGAGSDQGPSFPDIAGRRTVAELRTFLAQTHANPMSGF